MATDPIQYDRKQLRAVTSAFKAMSDEAVDAARRESSALAEFAAAKIKDAAATRTVNPTAVQRIASGVKVSKTSKIGEFSYGFASQKFSGGGSTRDLWAGFEFGSNKFKQFPTRTPNRGRGNSGYFIYPTLRQIQPQIIAQWEDAFTKILKEYD
jgi:hypothetical protein